MSLVRAALILAIMAREAPALAEAVPPPTAAVLAERAAHRFPQPVQVGRLIGLRVLAPVESQPVLGRVDAVARGPGGGLLLVMRWGGVLGLGARRVAVPLDAVALLGEYVALVDLTPEQLDAWAAADPALVALAGDQVIRMGIVRPFH